jgi:signal transduction histidine kinase
MDDLVPLASPAAWSPTAAPAPQPSRILTLDDAFGQASTGADVASRPEPVLPVAPPAPRSVDRLAALRDIARKLRTSPDGDETLQHVIDAACRCTASDAGMLTLSTPASRQFVSGTALGAGPYISVPLRAGGPSFGEIVLTRMADADEYGDEDETFAELVAEYVAKAVSTLRAGTVISQESQDFIDRVTEELRSPLAGTVSTLGAVLSGETGTLPDDAQRYLATAHADAGRLLATVDDLLTLAHLRPPELRDMEAIPVTPWLERGVARFRPQAERRGITLTHRPAPQAYVVQAAPRLLDVVLDALLSNAVKFTEPGGRVDVTAGQIEGLVRVSVRDTGIGFDPGDAPRMLECFARSITAEAARIPGLGVGLYLANEIVKAHNGRLWLESRRDEGTQAHVGLVPRPEHG